MNKLIAFAMLFVSVSAVATPPPGAYNQQFTYNQNMQYGSTNWYSSPLGQGAAMAGVALVSGLVNAMSRPDPVVVQQPQYQQQQPQYQQPQGYGYPQQYQGQYAGPAYNAPRY